MISNRQLYYNKPLERVGWLLLFIYNRVACSQSKTCRQSIRYHNFDHDGTEFQSSRYVVFNNSAMTHYHGFEFQSEEE